MANIIDAIINLVTTNNLKIKKAKTNSNRINNIGDSLEKYIQDLFAGSFNLNSRERLKKIENTFSYLGNSSNPPDAMLKNGDAIEVKKIQRDTAYLALNSSHPKTKLFANSPLIKKACKEAEEWETKDMLYITGLVSKNVLKHLTMVYGEDYCADEEVYLSLKNRIKKSIQETEGIDFSETRELGRVNNVDPLGNTYLRIRGMWGILTPWKAFDYIFKRNPKKDFTFMSIINYNKWETFQNRNELIELSKKIADLKIEDVEIQNPNNPAKLKKAKLITYYK